MNKYKTFIYFLLLTAVWSLFYSAIKYFLWGDLSSTLNPSLQVISGYLSFGATLSYLVGGAIAYTFIKKYILIIVCLFITTLLSFAYFYGINTHFGLGSLLICVGFSYGIWSVLKNVIISIEIKKTGLGDTKVNALASIVFIVFIILGSISGGLLHEQLGAKGFSIIILIIAISGIISAFLNYDKQSISGLFKNGLPSYYSDRREKFTKSIHAYIPDVIYITKEYYIIMFSSAILWGISTAVSQKIIEHSVLHFDKTTSQAAIVLLYSAVGVIVGNIISIRLEQSRWKAFCILNIVLSIIIGLFPYFAISFLYVSILALIIGLFFGGIINLIDAFFFRTIGEENKKEYGSSTFGLITSFTIFIIMFVSSFIDNYLGFQSLMLFFGIIILLVGLINLKQKQHTGTA